MEPLLYVMAIMGCADGSTMCAEARVEPARYRTAQACQAAMPAALMRNSDLAFPVISASCKSTGATIADRRPARGRTAG